MRTIATVLALLSVAAVSSAQQRADFKPAETNVWGAEYPRVDATGRVEIRIKAADAAKARINWWSSHTEGRRRRRRADRRRPTHSTKRGWICSANSPHDHRPQPT